MFSIKRSSINKKSPSFLNLLLFPVSPLFVFHPPFFSVSHRRAHIQIHAHIQTHTHTHAHNIIKLWWHKDALTSLKIDISRTTFPFSSIPLLSYLFSRLKSIISYWILFYFFHQFEPSNTLCKLTWNYKKETWQSIIK